ncbi:MAG: thiamine pyrophosphate-dependent dehydrogenase E1 component subunit alpha [Caldilineaceae bacterium]|nr:thiamine pyrophosphate-dependent dehydrogenase E1 component subunit alpha [Caldilineaceae bacterium]MBP8106705.1 thiamine pyrophosphate-dependent dehydrogenase E1 component subunit alpha [Caldilineaceae bacterium]MBP8125828.1 thiamine pyrophosphate-dependent dehydrogenase E1 component subunit alpha [Caldilineaceae bacterium]MBP9074613.1 thiamine pyrophosphate-dependent dehydrogenase E1 component subunit alpha [Caldilineaceae bacterium]
MPTKSLTTDLLPSEAATAVQAEQLPVEQLKEMYRVMLLIRRVEESLLQMAESGKIGGAMHTAIGHEGGGVGAAYATMGDYVTCTYRGHHHGIARGMDVKRAMAEVLGRADGFAGGKGGSMHFYAPELGMMGANGIVGAQVPQAAGLALASKLRKEGKIAITFFGEGAIFQGVMHETFNIASKWKLPIIFYCENNRYSEMTPTNRTSSIDEIYTFGHTYGMESMQIDGNDVEVVYTAVKQAADRARAGEGPTFIEGLTYRLSGHMAGDLETYRTSEEIDLQRAYEPLIVLRQKLVDRGVSEDELGQISASVEAEIAEAVEFAETSPWPDVSEAYTHVYK